MSNDEDELCRWNLVCVEMSNEFRWLLAANGALIVDRLLDLVNGFLMEHFGGNLCIYLLVGGGFLLGNKRWLSTVYWLHVGVIGFIWVISIPCAHNRSPPSLLLSTRKRFTWKETVSDWWFDTVVLSVCRSSSSDAQTSQKKKSQSRVNKTPAMSN